MFVLCLLALKEQDRSTGLEAHLVSANSKYIEEQQEQQQVKENEMPPSVRGFYLKQSDADQRSERWFKRREKKFKGIENFIGFVPSILF